MKSIGILTAVAVVGLAGMASAQCSGWGHEATTAEMNYTPTPTAEVDNTEKDLLLLPKAAEDAGEKAEG